jgi:asparagine synthase (glutamine-hydrolysing)
MPLSGAFPANAAFVSGALRAQRLCPDATNDSFWQDEWITLGGSDDVVTCIQEKLVLFFQGGLIRQRELSSRLGTAGNSPLPNILAAYRRWGDDFTRYLHGEFALALWDAGNRRLVLARDAGSYRPLHYWVRGEQFRFASEARGLLAHGDIPLAANERRIAQRLSGTQEGTGDSFFRGISCVPSGHTVVWEHGRVMVRDFWKPANVPRIRLADPREYAEGLRSVLEEAVRDRIEAFSAVGCHLSGGLDSSSVTATAARILQERGGHVTAFTAVPSVALNEASFPGQLCDESSHAASTAQLYPNIEHVLIPNISGGILGTLDSMSSASGAPQPNVANLCWLRAICMDAASRGLRAMLTGGAGNLTISWSGQRALSTLLASGRIAAAMRLSRALRRNGKTWSSTVKSGFQPLLPSSFRRIFNSSRGSERFDSRSGLRKEFVIGAGLDPQEALDSLNYLDGTSLRIWCIRRFDLGGYVTGLRRLTGVEEMDPTCDRRVMEFCLSVPEEHYCANGRGRSLIRDAMSGMVPPRVLEERRRGRQSADVLFHLTREKAEIEAELKRLKKIDLAVQCLNLPALESLVQAWPSAPYGSAEHMKYASQLMRPIAMGRFIRRVEEGTLFREQLPEGTGSALSTTSV